MTQVGKLIAQVLNDVKSETALSETRKGVAALTDKFPLYAWKREAVTTAV